MPGWRAQPSRHGPDGWQCKQVLQSIYKNCGGITSMHNLADGGPGAPAVAKVRELRYTHAKISKRFGNGAHAGQPLRTLVDALESGEACPADVGLFVMEFGGNMYALNNRRLWALK